MGRPNRWVLPLLVAVCLLTLHPPAARAVETSRRHILLLNSYHKGLGWTDSITDGIESVFKAAGKPYDLQVEYMDTSRICDSGCYRMLYELYKFKFRNHRFDVVLTSDDEAFQFIREYGDFLFPGAPVVFCGVNYFHESALAGRKDITGIVESFDTKATIDAALSLHPKTKRVFVINDRTTTGLANRKILQELAPAYLGRLEFLFPELLDMGQVLEQVRILPPDSIVLLMSFTRDRSGSVYSYDESIELVAANCRVPIYGVWDFYLGHGIVGGMLTTGSLQGKMAAQMALRVLSGEKAADIPVTRQGANAYRFDYRQLDRFDVGVDALPAGSTVINSPASFYREHRQVILDFAAVIAGLAGIIAVLSANIIRRRTAEGALRESNRKIDALVQAIPDVVIFKDPEGRHVFVNKAFEKLFGRPPADVIGKTDGEILPADLVESCRRSDREVVESRETRHFEERQVLPDGVVRHFDSTKTPLMDENGEVIGLVGVIRDVTQRKKDVEALRESEARYRILVDTSPDAIFLADTSLRILMVNPQAQSLLGYDAGFEMIGRDALEFLSGEDRDKAREDLRGVLSSGDLRQMEYGLRRKDGTTFTAELNASTIRDDGGRPTALIGVFRDVTERKRVADILRESEHKFRMALEHNPLPVMLFDVEGKVLLVNTRFGDLTGYGAGDVDRLDAFLAKSSLCGEESAAFRANVGRSLGSGSAVDHGTMHVVTRGGEERVWNIQTAAIGAWDGRTAIMLVGVDLTDKVALEKQLFRSQKMEAIGRLAGGLAHDINNYLGAILGSVEIVRMTHAADGGLARRMETIVEITGRASALIRQLLAFSRRQLARAEVLNLNAAVEGLAKMMKQLIGEDVVLSTRLSRELWNVRIDPSQVEQILVNLLVNARDAMPGGGKASIETDNLVLAEGEMGCHPLMEPGRYAMLTVSDTGVGIPDAIREKIFEPFFTTKGKGKGSGLGLSTVYGIVKQHGGYIGVDSGAGRGTRFRICLPVCDEPLADQPSGGPGDSRAAESCGFGRVLLVEDNDDVRESTKEILEHLGYEVVSAARADEGLARFGHSGDGVDLVITDVVMPGMSGRELAERIRERKAGQKVLFMSGYTEDVIAYHGILQDGIEFIGKPFSASDLSLKIRDILR